MLQVREVDGAMRFWVMALEVRVLNDAVLEVVPRWCGIRGVGLDGAGHCGAVLGVGGGDFALLEVAASMV